MSLKRLAPVLAVALLLLATAAVIVGATGSQQVKVPQGGIVESPNARGGMVDNGVPTIPDAPKSEPARPGEPFSDDFATDTDVKGGRYESLASAPGSWKIKSNRLQQRGDESEDLSDAPAVLLVKGVTFANNSVSAQIYGIAMPVGLVFRGSDAGYYRLTLYRQQETGDAPKATLEKVVGTQATEIASAPTTTFAGYANQKWQTVKVTAVGDRITASVDGTTILDVTDSSFSSGWAGVWATADATTQFDNVRIENASANR
ncbi:MAG TPA: hypothetical protein VF826_13500 [Chloroflexia bacterium]